MAGEIVTTRFPFTDFSAFILRPALVLAPAGPDNWILCQLTTRDRQRYGGIRITPQDLQTGTLRRDSWARPEHLHTIAAALLSTPVGQLTDAKLAEVLAAVRNLF